MGRQAGGRAAAPLPPPPTTSTFNLELRAPRAPTPTLLLRPPPARASHAGGNAGFSTSLFKLLWPKATVITLEPDPSNFEALKRNTQGCAGRGRAGRRVEACPPRTSPACRLGVAVPAAADCMHPSFSRLLSASDLCTQPSNPPLPSASFEGVHLVNGGLWGRTANITLSSGGGRGAEWGKVFREAQPGEEGIPAYGVNVSLDLLVWGLGTRPGRCRREAGAGRAKCRRSLFHTARSCSPPHPTPPLLFLATGHCQDAQHPQVGLHQNRH